MAKEKKKNGARKTTLRNVFQDGPYLVTAIICEKVLQEQDGVKSAIRIVDRITHSVAGPDVPEKMPTVGINFQLLIKMKSGKSPGKHHIKVTLVDPRKKELGSVTQTINMEQGESRGMDILLPINMKIEQEGVFWFEIWCDDFLMTKTPLEIRYVISKQTGPQPPDLIQ